MKRLMALIICTLLVMQCLAATALAADAAKEPVTRSVDVSRDDKGGFVFALDLTQEELARDNVCFALTLLRKESDGGYRWVYRNSKMPSEGNKVFFDGLVLCKTDEAGEPTYFAPAIHEGRMETQDIYSVGAMLGYGVAAFCATDWTLVAQRDTGKAKITDIQPREGEDANEADWEYVSFTSSTRKPTTDAENRLLPYFQWEQAGLVLGFDVKLDGKQPTFAQVHVDACTGVGTDEADPESDTQLYALLSVYTEKGEEVENLYPVGHLVALPMAK